jgi:hypothetical protein
MQISKDTKIRDGGPPGTTQRTQPILNLRSDGTVQINDYPAFFLNVIEVGPFVKDGATYQSLKKELQEYTDYLQALCPDYYQDLDDLIDGARKYYRLHVPQEKYNDFEDFIEKIDEIRDQMELAEMLHGDLHDLAEELIDKKDFKNARIAIAIAFTYSLFNEGSIPYRDMSEVKIQDALLPAFLLDVYAQDNGDKIYDHRDYAILKTKLLKLLKQK